MTLVHSSPDHSLGVDKVEPYRFSTTEGKDRTTVLSLVDDHSRFTLDAMDYKMIFSAGGHGIAFFADVSKDMLSFPDSSPPSTATNLPVVIKVHWHQWSATQEKEAYRTLWEDILSKSLLSRV
uniref:Uncharacterized protein n=1 Tax=Vitrella brassicaformis TaxID=1169539 RepID=A0A7S1JXB6_9ALVE|mmetsp:Transcript_27992/g.69894  ORF Transcript_27992/g.69894 Transcript_27992/m.69894 type:complete len:123 (+) Transcript_27992:243-611(+)